MASGRVELDDIAALRNLAAGAAGQVDGTADLVGTADARLGEVEGTWVPGSTGRVSIGHARSHVDLGVSSGRWFSVTSTRHQPR